VAPAIVRVVLAIVVSPASVLDVCSDSTVEPVAITTATQHVDAESSAEDVPQRRADDGVVTRPTVDHPVALVPSETGMRDPDAVVVGAAVDHAPTAAALDDVVPRASVDHIRAKVVPDAVVPGAAVHLVRVRPALQPVLPATTRYIVWATAAVQDVLPAAPVDLVVVRATADRVVVRAPVDRVQVPS